MAIRSGRIKGNDVTGTNALTIIKGGKVDGRFRIYNSGETEFIVKPNGTGTPSGQQVTVPQKGSADIEPDGEVIITQTNAAPVEGMYEYIDPFNPIRNGRFKGNASGNGITILQWKNGSTHKDFYRILNSGDEEFEVLVDGASAAMVKPTYSIDVFAGTKAVIKRADAKPVEGIYDYLHSLVEIRSGRFKVKKVVDVTGTVIVDPTTPHPIINLAAGPPKKAWYRAFNSGAHVIIILKGMTELHRLNADQSVDFEIGAGDRKIFVKSNAQDDPIEGIYEFLGRED
jgi:hypothetical protein